MCHNSSLFILAFLVVDTLALFDINFSKIINDKHFLEAQIYMILFSYCLSDLLSGFLVIISKKLMKSTKTEEKKEKKNGTLGLIRHKVKNDMNNKSKTHLLLIFAICLIDFLGRANSLVYYLLFEDVAIFQGEINAWILPIEMICRIIFSRLILKTKIYKHHYMLSLIILIIGYIPIYYIGMKNLNNWEAMISFAISRLSFCIGDVFTKKLFDTGLLLPHNVMLYKGCFAFLIHFFIFLPIIIFTDIISFTKGKDIFFIDDSMIGKLLIILLILLFFLRNIFILLIIYHLSPIHIIILVIIVEYLEYIMPVIFSDDYKYLLEPKIISLIIYFVLYVFIFFGALVFNEIIVINICGLNEHTMPTLFEKLKLERVSLDSEHYIYNGEEETEDIEKINE